MQIAVVRAGGKVLTRKNSVLSSGKSFKSLKPAPWVSALEDFSHGPGKEKQSLYRWCPGALRENGTAECARPSSLRQPEGRTHIANRL